MRGGSHVPAIGRKTPGSKKYDFLCAIPELSKTCSGEKQRTTVEVTLSSCNDPDVRAQPIVLKELLKLLPGPGTAIQEL